MERIDVKLAHDRYPVYVGEGIIGEIGSLFPEEMRREKVAIVTNPTVNNLYGQQVAEALKSEGGVPFTIHVPDSEISKSMVEAERLCGLMVDEGFDRGSYVLALGGGVVGDLAGFVSSIYMRGIRFVNVPTTLLGQVDSAIGGKTGVDLPQGKNLVGSFHQPRCVISDINVLNSLPEQIFKSGLAEVVKYGIILDDDLFNFLEANAHNILEKDSDSLIKIVTRCSRLKAGVIVEDERERGRRIILNFGHTLGHALEAAVGYSGYSHGEAVSIGMIFSAKLGVVLGMFKEKDAERLECLLDRFGLPIRTKVEPEEILRFMGSDKKSVSGKIKFIIPKAIGQVVTVDEIPHKMLSEILKEVVG